MKALQYLYTSWPNGNLPNKGYMIYSTSEGITSEECEDIRRVMRYQPPLSLVPNPTPEQIVDEFPYDFAYFRLSSGRLCAALTTYVGKDYSNRYGNYLIHALVFEDEDMDVYPVELFGEDFWRTYLTEVEIHAESPVPPLDILDIDMTGDMVNESSIEEFAAEHEEQTALLIDAYMEAVSRKVPLYLNDTRENIVIWCAVLQEMLPLRMAKELYFTTYAFNPSNVRTCMAEYGCAMSVMGVWQDRLQFDYAAQSHMAGCVVVDFLGNHVTEDLRRTETAKEIAADFTIGMDVIRQFDDFLDSHVTCSRAELPIETVYRYFQLMEIPGTQASLTDLARIMKFSERYVAGDDRRTLALKLLDLHGTEFSEGSLEEEELLLTFLYRYADIMMLTVNELFFSLIVRTIRADGDRNRGENSSAEIRKLLEEMQQSSPEGMSSFSEYFLSEEGIGEQSKLISSDPDGELTRLFAELLVRFCSLRKNQAEIERASLLLQREMQSLVSGKTEGSFIAELLHESLAVPSLFRIVLEASCDPNSKYETALRAAENFFKSVSEDEADRAEDALDSSKLKKEARVHLDSILMKRKKDPELAFWNMTNQLAADYDRDVDLSELVDSVTDMCKDPKAAITLIEHLDFAFIESAEVRKKVIIQAAGISMRELNSLNPDTAARLSRMAEKEGVGKETMQITAVLAGREAASSKERRKYQNFSEFYGKIPFSMDGIRQKTYMDILQCYLPDFLSLVSSPDDMGKLICCCFNSEYFIGFHNTYLDNLKRLEKKNEERWRSLVVDTCIWLINEASSNKVAERYRKAFIPYLKKLDDGILAGIQIQVEKTCGGSAADHFFETARQKVSMSERVGKLFGRKI